MSKVYTIQEVAEMLKVEDDNVRHLVKRGALRSFKAGMQYRITEDALNEYIESNQTVKGGK